MSTVLAPWSMVLLQVFLLKLATSQAKRQAKNATNICLNELSDLLTIFYFESMVVT